MFGLSKKERLTKKRNKVRKLINKKRGKTLINFDGIDESLLDEIIALGFFSDVYYSYFGINTASFTFDVPDSIDSHPEITDESVKEAAVAAAEETAENQDYIRNSYSSPEPTYTPDHEPPRSTSYSSGFSDSGDSGYDGGSSSDSSGSSSSGD